MGLRLGAEVTVGSRQKDPSRPPLRPRPPPERVGAGSGGSVSDMDRRDQHAAADGLGAMGDGDGATGGVMAQKSK